MMRGRPAVYATFSSYDEVAHHSGLERSDTLEALRKLDQQFGRIERARAYAARPYDDRGPLRPRADAGRDLQAAQRLRPRRPRRAVALARQRRRRRRRRRERHDGRPCLREATGSKEKPEKRTKNDVSDERRRRAGLRQPRARLPDGGTPPAHARGDQRAAPRPDPGAARSPARRLAAGALGRARPARARPRGHPLPRQRAGRRLRSAGGLLRRPHPGTSYAPTGSSTSPTS